MREKRNYMRSRLVAIGVSPPLSLSLSLSLLFSFLFSLALECSVLSRALINCQRKPALAITLDYGAIRQRALAGALLAHSEARSEHPRRIS